ncbi:MAG: PD-(D/E)XK nuclease family protein, partial [Candidatus Omnitrophota bacterium]|nr:PD-(D/E)XK nuclease family protein [Candidatus Omnitrophota bacterium]
MEKAAAYNLKDDFIEKLAGFIEENFIRKGSDLSRLALVFPGKRPALFLRRALSGRIKKSFIPPRFYSIDSFVDYTLAKEKPFSKMPDMEACYIIYSLAKKIAPEIIKGREKFSRFLPWAREIARFIGSLDTEDIPNDSLKNIQASAAIGYDVPKNINTLLKNIMKLRDAYHGVISEKNSFPKEYAYLQAARAAEKADFSEFDRILFCGFFYMQKTERTLIKRLCAAGKAMLFFQGDEDSWPVLKEAARDFSCAIKPAGKEEGVYSLNLYSAFDRHSQVCAVREILKKTKNLESTVIVLPDPAGMIPLVSEIGSSAGNFNVSLGYPLRRSSLYSLFEFIMEAQKTRKGKEYYARDYLAALSQPLVKNLKILENYSATRVLVHKLEETLLGMESTAISSRLFVELRDIEKDARLFESASGTLKNMGIAASPLELQKIIKELHSLLFTSWENINNFSDFTVSLGNLLDGLARKSFIKSYGLNLKIADRIYSIKEELENASFAGEYFAKDDIFKLFRNILENEMAAFAGSPLKGLQVLGILETRSLNFENVIVMDANEAVLPRLRVRDPLIPRDIALELGLEIRKKEEEIQRYIFTRVISAAKNVHLIYEENSEKEKSRFVEELIWQAEKRQNAFNVMPAPRVSFSVDVMPSRMEIKKTAEMIGFLKHLRYSASSIDRYVHCPLRFYYDYVLGLKEKEEFREDPQGREIGKFLHELLEDTFRKFTGKKPCIDDVFRMEFFEEFGRKFRISFARKMKADSFLLESVMRRRLERFLDNEEMNGRRRVEKIFYLEKKFYEKIEFDGSAFAFTYVVDRVDKLEDGSVLILDYKSGIGKAKPRQTGNLRQMELKRESIRDSIKSFQLPLYYYFEKKKYPDKELNAA